MHPGGDITGLAGSSDDSSPKQLELLATIVPNISRIRLLGNPDTETYSSVLNNTKDAAQKVGLSLVPIETRNPREIDDAFAAFAKQRVPAVMVAVDAVVFGQRWRIADLTYAKANPNKLNMASPGSGTGPHMASELFKLMTGVLAHAERPPKWSSAIRL